MNTEETPQEQTDDLAPIVEDAKQKLIKWHRGLAGDDAVEGDSPDAQSIVREAIEAAFELRSTPQPIQTPVTEKREDPTLVLLNAVLYLLGKDGGTDHRLEDCIKGHITEREERPPVDTEWCLRMLHRTLGDLTHSLQVNEGSIIHTSLKVIRAALDRQPMQ